MKKGTLKTVAVVLAFLLLGTAVVACMTQGFKDWNPYGWFDSKEDCEHEYGEDGKCTKCGKEKPDEDNVSAGFIVGGEDIIGNGIALHVMKDIKPLNSDEGIATVAETATSYTVTATVLDANSSANAIIQDVKWQMAWANSDTATVTNFVTMTTDGTKATFTLKAPFTTQIKVTCTSVFDSSKSATLTLDYAKRLQWCTVYTNNSNEYNVFDSQVLSVKFTDTWGTNAGYMNSLLTFAEASYGDGSIDNPITEIKLEVNATSALDSELAKRGSPLANLSSGKSTLTKSASDFSSLSLSQYDVVSGTYANSQYNTVLTPVSPSSSIVEGYCTAIANSDNQYEMTITFAFKYGDTVSRTVTLDADVDVSVSSVSLSKTEYVF